MFFPCQGRYLLAIGSMTTYAERVRRTADGQGGGAAMVGELGLDIGGLQVPDAGPVFLTTLAVHAAVGLVAVATGAVTCAAPKRAGRHPRTGLVYWYALGGVLASATVRAALRWGHDRQLFLIATVAFGLAALGRRIRRRLRPGCPARHG